MLVNNLQLLGGLVESKLSKCDSREPKFLIAGLFPPNKFPRFEYLAVNNSRQRSRLVLGQRRIGIFVETQANGLAKETSGKLMGYSRS